MQGHAVAMSVAEESRLLTDVRRCPQPDFEGQEVEVSLLRKVNSALRLVPCALDNKSASLGIESPRCMHSYG